MELEDKRIKHRDSHFPEATIRIRLTLGSLRIYTHIDRVRRKRYSGKTAAAAATATATAREGKSKNVIARSIYRGRRVTRTEEENRERITLFSQFPILPCKICYEQHSPFSVEENQQDQQQQQQQHQHQPSFPYLTFSVR
uniref:Uncharacterized protein n=1 Tax=Vespula pensylvanica TaxID=30213 RepID=A0A834NSK6_VESPE|nr:hypothetical protein H0235_011719 [Vespula pensylvanica]